MSQPFRQIAVSLNDLKVDALVVTGAENVRYLSGYTGSNGLILQTHDGPIFFTDTRYEIQAAEEVACRIEIVRKGSLIAAAAGMIRRKRIKRAGFERTHLSFEDYSFLDDQVGGARLLPVGALIEQQRMIKSEEEIGLIRRSVLTNSAAFDTVAKKIRPGLREFDVAAELEYQMRRLGAEKPAFDTIVASGDRTALPHARPTGRKLAAGDPVLIDMGAFQDGYASDMTRMLHLGKVTAEARRMYKAVLEAQLAAIDVIREGVPVAKVDRAARAVLASHGLDKAFTHSTGHGLGLQIHEPPRIARTEKLKLAAGMAITVEPGAYVKDLGGVRIEDTVVVTHGGCGILTPTPKEFRQI